MVDRAGRLVTANIAYQGVIGCQPVNTDAFTWKLAFAPYVIAARSQEGQPCQNASPHRAAVANASSRSSKLNPAGNRVSAPRGRGCRVF